MTAAARMPNATHPQSVLLLSVSDVVAGTSVTVASWTTFSVCVWVEMTVSGVGVVAETGVRAVVVAASEVDAA